MRARAALPGAQHEGAVDQVRGGVRRDHQHRVRLDLVAGRDVEDPHLGRRRQQAGELADLRGREVLEHHEREAGVGPHPREELLERLEASRRRADTDDTDDTDDALRYHARAPALPHGEHNHADRARPC
jgi:hypothetical protein